MGSRVVSDHFNFSKNRHRRFRDSDLLREFFETTVRLCMAERLVGGEEFTVDARLIKAAADSQNGVLGKDRLVPEVASHAVREHLAVLEDAAFWAATPVVPQFISTADSAARWTAAQGGQASSPIPWRLLPGVMGVSRMADIPKHPICKKCGNRPDPKNVKLRARSETPGYADKLW